MRISDRNLTAKSGRKNKYEMVLNDRLTGKAVWLKVINFKKYDSLKRESIINP